MRCIQCLLSNTQSFVACCTRCRHRSVMAPSFTMNRMASPAMSVGSIFSTSTGDAPGSGDWGVCMVPRKMELLVAHMPGLDCTGFTSSRSATCTPRLPQMLPWCRGQPPGLSGTRSHSSVYPDRNVPRRAVLSVPDFCTHCSLIKSLERPSSSSPSTVANSGKRCSHVWCGGVTQRASTSGSSPCRRVSHPRLVSKLTAQYGLIV